MPEPKRPLKVFLCHASTDKPKVRELYRYLKKRGIQPWFDEEDLVGGQDWQVEIPKALATSDAIIICLTKNSVDKEGYIQKEIKFALDKALEMPEGRIFLIPVKFEECEVPFTLSRYQWVDLTVESGYAKMMKALKFRALQLERSTVEVSKNNVEEQNFVREIKELESAEREEKENELDEKQARKTSGKAERETEKPNRNKKSIVQEVIPDKKVASLTKISLDNKPTSGVTKFEKKPTKTQLSNQNSLKPQQWQNIRKEIGLIAIVILGGILISWYFNNNTPQVPSVTNTPTLELSANTIFTMQDGFPLSIQVIDASGQNIMMENMDGNWLVTQPLGVTASEDQIKAIALQTSSLQIGFEVDIDADPIIFGLDNPQYIINIRFSNGNEYELDIGDTTPSSSGYYVRVDNKNIYVIGISEIDKLLSALSFLP